MLETRKAVEGRILWLVEVSGFSLSCHSLSILSIVRVRRARGEKPVLWLVRTRTLASNVSSDISRFWRTKHLWLSTLGGAIVSSDRRCAGMVRPSCRQVAPRSVWPKVRDRLNISVPCWQLPGAGMGMVVMNRNPCFVRSILCLNDGPTYRFKHARTQAHTHIRTHARKTHFSQLLVQKNSSS